MAWVNLLDIVYPVGSLYFTNNATSPAAIVGGSWTKIEEAAIRSSDTVGYVGADEHAITIEEMPEHSHELRNMPPWYVRNWVDGGAVYNQKSNTSNSVNYEYGDKVAMTGGGKRCLLSNVLTTAISTIVQHKNKGGL